MDICYADLESTGVSASEDRIVEFALVRGDGVIMIERVNPGIPIPAEATAIHGISDADVADHPTFAHYAEQIQAIVQESVLCTFNGRRFDTLMLHYELLRHGQAGLKRNKYGQIKHPEIDLYQIWARFEKRSLIDAALRFAGIDLKDAHSASADTSVLPGILTGMAQQLGFDGTDVETLCKLSVPDGAVDRDRKFLKRADGMVIYNFGPKKGELVQSDLGLLEWMLKKDFEPETKDIVRYMLDFYSEQQVLI